MDELTGIGALWIIARGVIAVATSNDGGQWPTAIDPWGAVANSVYCLDRVRVVCVCRKFSRKSLDGLTAGTIEEAVSDLDGVVDGIGSNVVVDLPETEADLGHVMARAELDVGNCNHLACSVGVSMGYLPGEVRVELTLSKRRDYARCRTWDRFTRCPCPATRKQRSCQCGTHCVP